MTNSTRVLFVIVVVILATLHVYAMDTDNVAIMRIMESRKQIDNPINWQGLMQGTFTSASFDAGGSGATVTGKYVLAFSKDCCLIDYRICMGEKWFSMKCLVRPDTTVKLCNGALPVSDVHSLPFDPYLIVQRPYILDRNTYGLSDYWLSRLSWIDYEEDASGSASISVKYNDSKGVYVVDNSDEHRGRLLSYASYDGSFSNGYNSTSSYNIEYSYYSDGIYPEKVLETKHQWFMPEDGQLSQRLEKSTSISVEFRTVDFRLDECSCESTVWETTFHNLLVE